MFLCPLHKGGVANARDEGRPVVHQLAVLVVQIGGDEL